MLTRIWRSNSRTLSPTSFVSYTTPDAWTFPLNTESSYDWNEEQWTVPVNACVSKLVTFGKQPICFQLGGRRYAEGPEGGPDWGMRFNVTFLFPKYAGGKNLAISTEEQQHV